MCKSSSLSMSVVGLSSISVDAEFGFSDGSERRCTGNDTSVVLTNDIEIQEKVIEENYSEQMSELKKAEEDLRLKEELYKQEDEARLEKLTAQNSFVEKLDVRKVQLMYFIEAQQQSASPLSTHLSLSDGHLNEVCDSLQEQMHPSITRTVSSASGRLLTTSRHKSLKDNLALNGTTCADATAFRTVPVGFKNKQHYRKMLMQTGVIAQKAVPAQRNAFERPSDLCLLPEFSVPWRLLSDDPDVKSRSASAPRLSDEVSPFSPGDETQLPVAQFHRLARSSSPRTTQLSNLSLVSVPESIHEEREESPVSGRLSVSEVDIRRHQFSSGDTRNRWSLDEEQLTGQSSAASIRCLAGSNQDVVITDSGLPSSPEASRLDSSVPSDTVTAKKPKEKALKQPGVPKSLSKPESGLLQKIGATLASLTRRQAIKQKPVSSVSLQNSHQQSDAGVTPVSHQKHAAKLKVQANTDGSKKLPTTQSKSKSKQLVSVVPKKSVNTSTGRSQSHSAEKKNSSAPSAQDKPKVPAKVRETFRSFRKRLKLTAGKSLKSKSGDIPVEIFLPKPKVVESSKDAHDVCAVEEQTYNAEVDTCISGEMVLQHISSDTDWPDQCSDRLGVLSGIDEMKLETRKGCDDDCQFSDDSLNDENSSSYCQQAQLHYEQMIEQVIGGQYFVPYGQEFLQQVFPFTNSDDGSFSEDSLAEDGSSGSMDIGLNELDGNPSSALVLCNTHAVCPGSAVTFVGHSENETSDNRQLETSVHASSVEPEEHYETDDEDKWHQQGGILPTSDLQVACVLRGHMALPTGTFTATHHFTGDNISASAAR